MDSSVLLACIIAAVVAGASGYLISSHFWSSDYSKWNKRGDFGGPRGGVFALGSGILIGALCVRAAEILPFFPQEASLPALLTAMFIGLAAGVIGMYKSRSKHKD